MDLFCRQTRRPDPEEVREEMTRDDPDFRRVRDVQHEAMGLIGVRRGVADLRDRYSERIRDSWRAHPHDA